MNGFLKKTAAAFCICGLLLAGCTTNGDETMLSINNREISKPEFMVYLYEATQDFKRIGGNDIWETDFDGQSAEDLVVERAVNTLQTVIITGEQANRYKVKLTDEDKETAKKNGDQEWNNMTEEQRSQIGISKEKLYSIMEESLLYAKVYDAATQDYQLSNADFQAYMEKNKADYMEKYEQFTVSSIVVKEESTAKEIADKAKSGEDFNALMAQYQENNPTKNGITETYRSQLETLFGVDFNLMVGETSEPLKTVDGYYVVQVLDIKEPADSEIEAIAKKEYISQMKKQLFNDAFQQWLKDSTIEKNDKAFENIEMIG